MSLFMIIRDNSWLFMVKISIFEVLGSLVLRLLIPRDGDDDHDDNYDYDH